MSRPFSLTAAQTKALDAQRNIAVTASAGSGKTATLVERYLELLVTHPKLSPNQILAITFTQKAASEMRERLGHLLQTAIQNTNDHTLYQRLLNLQEALPSARISTIHGFCATLLREYPIEAQVDPNFRLIEDVETALLRQETVQTVLQDIATLPPKNRQRQALSRLLNEWGRTYTENALNHMLSQPRLARTWCQSYADSTSADILTTWQQHIKQIQHPASQAILGSISTLEYLAELLYLHPHSNSEKDTAAAKINPIRALLEEIIAAPTAPNAAHHLPTLVLALTTTQGKAYKGNIGNKANWDAKELARFRQALTQAGTSFAPYHHLMQLNLVPRDERSAELLIALACTYLHLDTAYQQRKGPGFLLEFDELQEQACDLLYRNDGQLGNYMAQHIRFVMVDEFQDTDPLQWKLIRSLVSHQGQLDRDKLFIVGDPKQSIYAFRNADVALFAQVKDVITQANQLHQSEQSPFTTAFGSKKELPSQLEERQGTIVMAENFRTLQAPVDFVNFLFSQFMHADPDEPFQVAYAPLLGQRLNTANKGSVEFLFTPINKDTESTDYLLAAANLLASRIATILTTNSLRLETTSGDHPVAPDDIAILFRRRRLLPLFEQALRRYQVPFQVVGGLGFYQQQEVFDLANILRILHNPLDSIALLGALRSPYLKWSDNGLFTLTQRNGDSLWEKFRQCPSEHPDLAPIDRQALTTSRDLIIHWQQLKDRISLTSLVQQILTDTGAWGFLAIGERGTQNSANVDKFLQLARSFNNRGFKPLGDFVAHLNHLIEGQEREGEAVLDNTSGAVQIMTIHASKGLEFPLVFIPDLDAPLTSTESHAVLLDPDHGIGLSVLDPDDEYQRNPSFVRRLIADKRRRQNIAEAKRLFYVAATRARDHLFLAACLDPDHLQSTADFSLAKSALSWLCSGFNLTPDNIAQGSTHFTQDDRTYTIPIYTQPLAASSIFTVSSTEPAAYTTISSKSPLGTETPPAALHPLLSYPVAPVPLQITATQLVLFEQDPQTFQEQHLTGLDATTWNDCIISHTITSKQRAMLFGSLAHTALEALGHNPTQDDAAQIDCLLAEAVLPDAALQDTIREYLLAHLQRFRNSPHSTPWLAATSTYLEHPFILSFNAGTITSVIDRIYCDTKGQWHLVDYKTNHITLAALTATAKHYKRQMEIYALCMQRLFPTQSHFSTTLYFSHIDAVHTFHFTPASLAQTQSEIEVILQQIVQLENTVSPHRLV